MRFAAGSDAAAPGRFRPEPDPETQSPSRARAVAAWAENYAAFLMATAAASAAQAIALAIAIANAGPAIWARCAGVCGILDLEGLGCNQSRHGLDRELPGRSLGDASAEEPGAGFNHSGPGTTEDLKVGIGTAIVPRTGAS